MGRKEKISPERKEAVKYLLENYEIKTPQDIQVALKEICLKIHYKKCQKQN